MTTTTKTFIPELGVWKTIIVDTNSTITAYTIDADGRIFHNVNGEPAYVEERNIAGKDCVFRQWYHLGLLHRDGDLPAEITYNGTQEYYKHGLHHRENGLPAIVEGGCEYVGDDAIYPENAHFVWCVNGVYARPAGDHGPTEIEGKIKAWYVGAYGGEYTVAHNEHGPAVIRADGDCLFYLNDVLITEEQFNQIVNKQ